MTAPLQRMRESLGIRLPLLGRWPIHGYPSLLSPRTSVPSERLLEVAVQAIDAARQVNLEQITARLRRPGRQASAHASARFASARASRHPPHSPPPRPDAWPGHHYKLLAALVALLEPRTVIEIGTATGMSALAMRSVLPEDGTIFTFDPVPWQEYPGALLREEDFADGRLEQRLDDLSTAAGWSKNAELLRRAELILVDARHDGKQEREFARGFDEVGLAAAPIVVFDDIRLWRMMRFWRDIERPKLDITSFGHWSGTGLVDYA